MRLCERSSKINCDVEVNITSYTFCILLCGSNNLHTLTMGYKTLRSMMANLECRILQNTTNSGLTIKCAKSTTSSKCMNTGKSSVMFRPFLLMTCLIFMLCFNADTFGEHVRPDPICSMRTIPGHSNLLQILLSSQCGQSHTLLQI